MAGRAGINHPFGMGKLHVTGKRPDGACPDFDYGSARVLAYRNILQSVQSELLRLTGQGLLAAR